MLVLLALASLVACVMASPHHHQQHHHQQHHHQQQHHQHHTHADIAALTTTATVFWNASSQTFYAQKGVIDKQNGLAWGTFEDTLNVTGWGVLNVYTNPEQWFLDNYTMYAAGYVEAVLTQPRIFEMSINMNAEFFGGNSASAPAALRQYFASQDSWINQQIAANPKDNYWQQIDFIIQQFNGLVQGYLDSAPKDQTLSRWDIQILNAVGDLLDLMNFLGGRQVDFYNMTSEQFDDYIFSHSLCSALVKVTGDYSDLFSAHSSWFTYSATNRIYKHYHFDLNAEFVSSKTISFSSYPGFLESLDDFYIMSNGLVMLQTTNSIFNQSLYTDYCTPQSLLAWHRVRLANSMARTGEEWYQLFSKYNSGTYNNQYMLINYNLFKVGEEMPAGLLYVCEQIPGYVTGGDITRELERGYFASYNVPYFLDIYALSGYPDMVKLYGESSSYQLAPRATIFRRDAAKVTDLESFKRIMRYNDFKNDPYSHGNAGWAICSRGDLRSKGASPGGCYDTKVTSDKLVPQMISYAQNGPTHDDLPPFSWSEFPKVSHYGLPATYNFDFVQMQPKDI